MGNNICQIPLLKKESIFQGTASYAVVPPSKMKNNSKPKLP